MLIFFKDLLHFILINLIKKHIKVQNDFNNGHLCDIKQELNSWLILANKRAALLLIFFANEFFNTFFVFKKSQKIIKRSWQNLQQKKMRDKQCFQQKQPILLAFQLWIFSKLNCFLITNFSKKHCSENNLIN